MTETGFAEWFNASHRDGACTNFIENFHDNSLKQDLSNATTFNPPHFSLVDTFKQHFYIKYHNHFSLYQHLHATYPSSSSYKTRKEWLFKLF